MCGIVGKVNFDPGQPVDAAQIARMAASLRHRGPDDDGIWINGRVGLGHRRLSIIDLSPNGRNPMCNEDGTVWIVFNGEIYNFRELRTRLDAAGHHFKSRTDTEVIVHLYEELGPRCVTELRGMFAFALWDCRKQLLMLARDRLGVKPLHYSVTQSGLLFASEIKALLCSGGIDSARDPVGLHHFLVWQCIPSPRTAFQNIRKLPPASVLTWMPGRDISIQKYWQPDYSSPIQCDVRALSAQVRDLLQEATTLRLTADVPVGIFLSGGIDSACVLASARKANSGKIQTFSVTFGDERFDESHYARLLASHFETEHHEFHVTPAVVEMVPAMAGLFDEPFGDAAAIPTYYLSQLTRAHVTVALSGDGGDESFGGYQRYFALTLLGRLRQLPGSAGLRYLRGLMPYNSSERSAARYIRELLSLLDREPKQQYRAMFLGMHDEIEWASLYTDEYRVQLSGSSQSDPFLQGWTMAALPDDLTRAMASDTVGYIPECLTVKTDMASMACGLEVRSPFLDHVLVEFCARIPSRMKIAGMHQKYILKRAFAGELPATILRRKKAGFAMPLASWMRSELRDFVTDTLLASDSHIEDIVRRDALRSMLREHMTGTRNRHIQLWRLLLLDNWLKAQAGTSNSSERLSHSPGSYICEQQSSPNHVSQLRA